MKKKILVIGAGKFAQVFQLPNIKKLNFDLYGICDPRNKLVKKVAKLYNFKRYYNNINDALKIKYDIIFLFSSRLSSYEIIKEIIKKHNHNSIIFSEKPSVFNLKQSMFIKKLINNSKLKFISGYMLRYDKMVIEFKEILKNRNFEKKFGKILNVNCSINNNKLYSKPYRYIRTQENKDFNFDKNQFPKHLSSKLKVNYHVFINRYSHLINLINFYFKIKKIEKFQIKDIYNYNATMITNFKVYAKFRNERNYVIKFDVKTKNYLLRLILYNPALIMNSKIKIFKFGKLIKARSSKTDVFFSEIKDIVNLSKKSKTTEKNLFEDFTIIDSLWNTNEIDH